MKPLHSIRTHQYAGFPRLTDDALERLRGYIDNDYGDPSGNLLSAWRVDNRAFGAWQSHDDNQTYIIACFEYDKPEDYEDYSQHDMRRANEAAAVGSPYGWTVYDDHVLEDREDPFA